MYGTMCVYSVRVWCAYCIPSSYIRRKELTNYWEDSPGTGTNRPSNSPGLKITKLPLCKRFYHCEDLVYLFISPCGAEEMVGLLSQNSQRALKSIGFCPTFSHFGRVSYTFSGLSIENFSRELTIRALLSPDSGETNYLTHSP